MSWITAVLCFLGGIALLAFGEQVPGILWITIGLVWLGVAIGRGRADQPIRHSRLIRRFSRMMIFWS
jgi:hypothetical protein